MDGIVTRRSIVVNFHFKVSRDYPPAEGDIPTVYVCGECRDPLGNEGVIEIPGNDILTPHWQRKTLDKIIQEIKQVRTLGYITIWRRNGTATLSVQDLGPANLAQA